MTRSKGGRTFSHKEHPEIDTEFQELWDRFQRTIRADDLDIRDVAIAVGKEMQDGEINALNRALDGQFSGRRLILTQTSDNQYALYAVKQNKSGDSFPSAYFYSDADGTETADIVNAGDGSALRLTGRNGNIEPVLEILTGSGTADVIDVTNLSGCKCDYLGRWQDASSRHLKENFRPLGQILRKIKKLEVWEYNHKTDPAQKKRIGPTAEQYLESFGMGDGEGISGSELASIAIAGIQELLDRVESLEKKVKKLEAPDAGR